LRITRYPIKKAHAKMPITPLAMAYHPTFFIVDIYMSEGISMISFSQSPERVILLLLPKEE
jgi:hypothetical protein